MSAFSEYAARTERTTSLNRFTPVDVLALAHRAGQPTPVSGDMLAVLRQATPRQRTRRRALALAWGRK